MLGQVIESLRSTHRSFFDRGDSGIRNLPDHMDCLGVSSVPDQGDSGDAGFQLEGRALNPNSVVLSDRPNVPGKSAEILGHGNEGARSDSNRSENSRRRAGCLMPTITIKPNHNARMRYNVPSSRTIAFEIEADIPVKSYIVRTRGLELFDDGSRNFKYYGGFPAARKKQSQELILPYDEGHWWLVIVNPSSTETAEVRYEVEF